MRATLMLLLALCLAACQKTAFDDDNQPAPADTTFVPPTSTGRGTEASPYTVAEIREGKGKYETWMIGYIVGSTRLAMGAASYVVPTDVKANILLARDTACHDHERCVPVELKSTVQDEISLNAHPELLHQCIMVRGTTGKYYNVNGLRKADAYHLLPDFDLSAIDPTPENWSGQIIPF